jgi:predicted amino acid racemase
LNKEELKDHNKMVEATNKKYGIDMTEMLKEAMRDQGYKTFIDTDGVEKVL